MPIRTAGRPPVASRHGDGGSTGGWPAGPKNLTLIGLGATLDGSGTGTVVTVLAGVRAQLTALTITHGGRPATGYGGGIHNRSVVRLILSRVFANTPNNCAPPGSMPGCAG